MDTPKVFISYSWDSDEHKDWVRNLAEQLIDNGVNIILDQYEMQAGDNITYFMERAVGDTDMVLLVLTENYKVKSEGRSGGVGYEYSMINAEWYKNQAKNTKFIPILRGDNPDECLPDFLSSYLYVDMSNDSNFEEKFRELIFRVHEERIIPKPPIGNKPDFGKISNKNNKKETDSKDESKRFKRRLSGKSIVNRTRTLYGAIIDEKKTFGGIKIVPDNKTLMILQVNDEPDELPLPRRLKNLQEIFDHYRPQIWLDLETKEGESDEIVLKFCTIEDFTKEGIVKQSYLLQHLYEEQEIYGRFKDVLRSNAKLKAVVSDPEYKHELLELLTSLIDELAECEPKDYHSDEPQITKETKTGSGYQMSTNPLEKIKEKVAILKKQGGFGILKGVIDGKKSIREVDPKDEARRATFLTDDDKKAERKILSNELTVLRELIMSDDPVGLCKYQYEKVDSVLNKNLSTIFNESEYLERSYRCLDLFFRNTALEEVDNFYLINMPIVEFCIQTVAYDELRSHIKEKFEGFSLEDNYGIVILPGHLGGGLELLSNLALEYRFILVTDYIGRDIEDVVNADIIGGSEKGKAHTVVTCNRILARRKNERVEKEHLLIPASPALAGKFYINRGIQAAVGRSNGKLEGAIGTQIPLTRPDLIKINEMGLIPIVLIEKLGVVAMSDNTLAIEHENPDLHRLSVVRARNWIAKTILDYLNSHPFKVLDDDLHDEIMRELNKFFKKISNENGLVDEYDIEPIEVSDDYAQTVRIVVQLILKTTEKPYGIEFMGKAHRFEAIEHEA